jgi:hypothetical protein
MIDRERFRLASHEPPPNPFGRTPLLARRNPISQQQLIDHQNAPIDPRLSLRRIPLRGADTNAYRTVGRCTL